MALLADLTELRARVAASGGRLEKRRLVALYLRALPTDDLARAVTYLSGRAFPAFPGTFLKSWRATNRVNTGTDSDYTLSDGFHLI